MTTDLKQRLADLGVKLPSVAGPFGAYVPAKRVGNLVYVAGTLPMENGTLMATGQVPSRCGVERAKAAARQCVVNALAAVQGLGVELEHITGVVRVGVFVSSDASFIEQPTVANGASELLLELFDDAGRHVRSAVGVNTLPLDAAVEIEFIFQTA